MPYTEKMAVEELKSLPCSARMHLQHTIRNFLQTVSGCVETALDEGLPEGARSSLLSVREAVRDQVRELERLGL